MRLKFSCSRQVIVFLTAGLFGLATAHANELVETIQKDLLALGYFSENADGELDLPTQIAIGKFEEASGMTVTGQPSIALANKTSLAVEKLTNLPAPAAGSSAMASVESARQKCLDEKSAAAEGQDEGLFSLAGQGGELLSSISNGDSSRKVYDIRAIDSDLASVARDFGISEESAAECLRIGAGAASSR